MELKINDNVYTICKGISAVRDTKHVNGNHHHHHHLSEKVTLVTLLYKHIHKTLQISAMSICTRI